MSSDLTQIVNRLLGPQTSLSSKMALLDSAEKELLAQQSDYRKLYRHLPAEGRQLEKAFDRYSLLLDNLREALGTQEAPPEKIDELLEALKDLKGLQFYFKEYLWASRGPSTHPGLNQLLVLLAGDDEEALYAHIKSEGKRVEAQDGVLNEQPEFLRKPLAALIDEYYELLREMIETIEEGALSEERENLEEQLRVWGDEYSCHDIAGLKKRYGDHPTAVSEINFYLNMRRLYLDKFIQGELFDYVYESTMAEQKRIARWVESNEELAPDIKARYLRAYEVVSGLMEEVARAGSLDRLKELGTALGPGCEEIATWQRQF